MMRRILPFLAVFVAAAWVRGEPVDFSAACAGLGQTKRQHPYLLFTNEDKPAIRARIKADAQLGEIWEKYRLEGRRLLHADVEREGPERVLHTRYVGADDYRRFVGGHLEAAFTLAFLYQMTGDEAYVAKAFAHADVVCAQESWVQSAHMFPIIYSRVWPYGAKDDQVVFTYDITASATSQQMAYVYDWLYPALSKAQRDRIRGALLEKAITRVRGNYEYFWWATAYKCNWSGICHTGLGLTALALLDEDPQLEDVVARSCTGISAMFDHIGEEGGWQEGRGYWAFAMGECVRFMDAVRRVSGGKVDLFKHRAISPHPLEFALYGMTAGFGDGSGAPVSESYTVNKLVAETGDPAGAWYARNFVRSRESLYDLIWPATSVEPALPADTSRLFRNVDWAVMRRDFRPESVTVATKAGMNDDPHHGHLDCGTFNITWQGLTFVGEVPRTSYDENYFGAERWDYVQARTAGHNCVMVNGEEQAEAKLKDQPWKEGIGGHITFYASEPSWGGVVMDATKAYPGKELKRWNRAIVLDKERNIVVVLDQVRAAAGAKIEARFHPGVEFHIAADGVQLQPRVSRELAAARTRAAGSHRYDEAPDAARGGLRGMVMKTAVASGTFAQVQGRQPEMPVTKDAQVTWIPYFSTVVTASGGDDIIASVFCPADLASAAGAPLSCKAERVAGAVVVTYTVRGEAHRFRVADQITAQ